MGRNLSLEEKLNAQNEFYKIKEKTPILRQKRRNLKCLMKLKSYAEREAEFQAKIDKISKELQDLSKRRKKLCDFINYQKKSKHNGLYILESESYKLLGKSRTDFTREDWRVYDRHMHRLRIAKEKANETS
jgi:chorismate mutase